ncbi:MAG: hypothetical protein M3O34_08340 [Chloroflexota bacterium]|nr:hypothetical protein [Chloroflexota bacterium]
MAHATVPQPDRVAAVLATAPTWVHGRRKADNRPFVIVPASDGGRTYYVDARGTECTCPDRQTRRRTCKHMAAVREYNATRDVEAFEELAFAALAPDAGAVTSTVAIRPDRYSVLFPAED